ncbi:protein gvpG [Salinigranum rubrum]|uniref:Protein gvpG n=1 Tax=Salinigranum rubrum TaxID=755307 RepID=A0A2I8VKK6_9EURY|nr:protein gvpG [Salinigranum rubrum]AUV82451.1 protein gvpG [Salinigranum rubrum]
MLLLDDLLVRPFTFLLRTLHDMALEECYDVEGIRDDLKENQLLYEIGERSDAEYTRRKTELEDALDIAMEARDRLSGKVEVMR